MKPESCRRIDKCRICGSEELETVIDLGEQYIASLFLKEQLEGPAAEPYPLEVCQCANPDGCGLVQLRHSVSPDLLYTEYGYLSGTNEIMLANLRGIVAEVESMAGLVPGDTVLDIGCNDGSLLAAYQEPGLDRLGFDLADNVIEMARGKGLDVVKDFFSAASFSKYRPGARARAVTSIAMFYDLEDPQAFVRDVASVLSDDGLWVLELSYLPFMLENNSFDTICHEHLEYYTLKQMEWLFNRAGLRLHRLELNDINGGSFRLFVRKAGFGEPSENEIGNIDRIRREERRLGLDTRKPYIEFRADIEKIRLDLKFLLTELKQAGKKVYIYGASTKGNTILQYCGLDNSMIPKAADRNPGKWGCRTLGTGIPIVSEEEARADEPDYFLILPWHFFKGFVKREAAFLDRGGRFILPLPEMRVLGRDDL